MNPEPCSRLDPPVRSIPHPRDPTVIQQGRSIFWSTIENNPELPAEVSE
jgi:hypothetical protein